MGDHDDFGFPDPTDPGSFPSGSLDHDLAVGGKIGRELEETKTADQRELTKLGQLVPDPIDPPGPLWSWVILGGLVTTGVLTVRGLLQSVSGARPAQYSS